MYQQTSPRPPAQPAAVRSQPRPVPCYNCGALEHLVMACPEPTRAIPAGLAAAKAAQVAQATRAAQVSEPADGGRPYKRQKTGPVVTRFPAPTTGPVVTHYAAPPTHAPQFATSVDQGSYGTQSIQAYQQYSQPHPYVQGGPQQLTRPANTYGLQPFSNGPYGYAQPAMSLGSQVHGSPGSTTQQSYIQPPALIPSQQYGYQASPNSSYPAGNFPTPPMPQQHAHNNHVQYGQQHMGDYSPQTYPNFQVVPQMQGQPQQQYPPYQGPSPNQTSYTQLPSSYQQQISQEHRQFLVNSPAYIAPAYQVRHAQYQPSYNNQYRKTQYPKPPYKAARFGQPNYQYLPSDQSPVPPVIQHSSTSHKALQQPSPSELQRLSNVYSSQHEGQDSSSKLLEPQNVDGEEEFDWDLEKSFVEFEHKAADEIAHPLPGCYSEEVILPPACDAKGITSKYVRPNNLEIFVRDIRSSLQWATIKEDPVFEDFDYDSPLIPLNDTNTWMLCHLRREQSIGFIAEESHQDTPPPQKALSCDELSDYPTHHVPLQCDVLEDHQRSPISPSILQHSRRPSANRSETPALGQITPGATRSGTPSFATADDAWAPQPGEGQISASPAEDPTEALLASLGVTGPPKPKPLKPASFDSAAGYKEEVVPELHAPRPSRQDSGYASQRGSYSAADNNTNYRDYRQSYDINNPPPPPPPPPRHIRRQFDGTIDSPPSDGSGRVLMGPGASSTDNQNSFQQSSSPLTPTSAESAQLESAFGNDRKKRPAPLRQVDDITPKLRRRQPKVADAYSRRW